MKKQQMVMYPQDYKRIMYLDEPFMNYEVDYVLLSFLMSVANARPTGNKTVNGKDENELYLTESRYVKCRPLLKVWMGATPQTIRNKMRKLEDKGIIIHNKEAKEYTFGKIEKGRYCLVSRNIIFYLCATTNSLVIQTYVYLVNKFKWKTINENVPCYFTVKEIKENLGYSKSSQNTLMEGFLKGGLVSLQSQGFIDFEVIQVKATSEEDQYKTQRYWLKDIKVSMMPDKLVQEIKKVQPKTKLSPKDVLLLE